MKLKLLNVGAVAVLMLSAGTATAQPQPPGAPPQQDPYKLPGGDTGNNDLSSAASHDQQLFKGTRDYSDAQAAKRGRSVAAKASDIVAGREVRDSKGVPVGSIESVALDGAVVATGTGRVMVPLEAFGKNRQGLVLSVTKAEFDTMVASASAQPAG
jgi:hypothetical protein